MGEDCHSGHGFGGEAGGLGRLLSRGGANTEWRMLLAHFLLVVQGTAKRSADFVKQQPGRVRQNS